MTKLMCDGESLPHGWVIRIHPIAQRGSPLRGGKGTSIPDTSKGRASRITCAYFRAIFSTGTGARTFSALKRSFAYRAPRLAYTWSHLLFSRTPLTSLDGLVDGCLLLDGRSDFRCPSDGAFDNPRILRNGNRHRRVGFVECW